MAAADEAAKIQSEHVDEKFNNGISSDETDVLNSFDPKEVKKIIHRIDRRLTVTIAILYCIALIDRGNLGFAAIAGMTKDLKLDQGLRYSTVSLVLFPTYIVFQFPATAFIRYLGPRNFLTSITLAWGCITIGVGYIHNWQALAGLRVALGLLEAGFFPGCIYLLSTWYTREEMHSRYSIFYLIGSLAVALAGIFAYGLMQMDGLLGHAGWRWIFIMEGSLTLILGTAGYFLIVGFPDDGKRYAGFLNDRETELILARVNKDRGDAYAEPFNARKFFAAALDPKIWGFALIFCMITSVTYALSYFLPLILRNGMGFSLAKAQCLTAPPFLLACGWMYATGKIGDHYRVQGPIIAFNAVLVLISLPIVGWVGNTAVRYFAVFPLCMGSQGNLPSVMAYQANNIRGSMKRAFCSASLISMGGIGGIIGSLVFRSVDAPEYYPGLYACIASQVIVLVLVGSLSIKFINENKKADRGELQIEGSEDGFRYTL